MKGRPRPVETLAKHEVFFYNVGTRDSLPEEEEDRSRYGRAHRSHNTKRPFFWAATL